MRIEFDNVDIDALVLPGRNSFGLARSSQARAALDLGLCLLIAFFIAGLAWLAGVIS